LVSLVLAVKLRTFPGYVARTVSSLHSTSLFPCTQVGGNSLQTGAVCSYVRSALGIQATIPAGWLFTHQTIRSLASKIADDVLAPGAVGQAPLLPAISQSLAHPANGSVTPAPLSFQQVHPQPMLPAHGCQCLLCPSKTLASCQRQLSTYGASAAFVLQEQFLQLWQQDPGSAAYNTPWGVCLQGTLDIEALQAAVQLLAERHLVSILYPSCHTCSYCMHQ
jgi:hypothetical protein